MRQWNTTKGNRPNEGRHLKKQSEDPDASRLAKKETEENKNKQ
jgi:hypothetical protein